MPRHPRSDPDHENDDTLINQSLRYHTRATLNHIATEIETLKHAVTAIDAAVAEVGADHPDRMRAAVVATREAILQLGVALLAAERGPGPDGVRGSVCAEADL